MSSFTETASILAALITFVLAGFQLYWAAGGTRWLGGAWGGTYNQLPVKLRVGSAASTLMFLLAGAFVLAGADYWEPNFSFKIVIWGIRVFAVVFLLSSFANFASSSKWERYLNGPSSLALAGLFLIVTLDDSTT